MSRPHSTPPFYFFEYHRKCLVHVAQQIADAVIILHTQCSNDSDIWIEVTSVDVALGVHEQLVASRMTAAMELLAEDIDKEKHK